MQRGWEFVNTAIPNLRDRILSISYGYQLDALILAVICFRRTRSLLVIQMLPHFECGSWNVHSVLDVNCAQLCCTHFQMYLFELIQVSLTVPPTFFFY